MKQHGENTTVQKHPWFQLLSARRHPPWTEHFPNASQPNHWWSLLHNFWQQFMAIFRCKGRCITWYLAKMICRAKQHFCSYIFSMLSSRIPGSLSQPTQEFSNPTTSLTMGQGLEPFPVGNRWCCDPVGQKKAHPDEIVFRNVSHGKRTSFYKSGTFGRILVLLFFGRQFSFWCWSGRKSVDSFYHRNQTWQFRRWWLSSVVPT